jgi:hypothetical protein
MGDLDASADLGTWVDFRLSGTDPARIMSIRLDTINYRKTNVTGWPLQYGHLFAALNDLTVKADLDKDVVVEFDIRVRASEVQANTYEGYSGRRVMIGTVGKWQEAFPRANGSHFMEVDLVESDGFAASYKDPRYRLCGDLNYDRCFYSAEGNYPEGREIRFQSHLGGVPIPLNTMNWTHVRVQLSDAIRRLPWVSRPGTWAEASLSGLYVGIESAGATRTWIEIRNYQIYVEGAKR